MSQTLNSFGTLSYNLINRTKCDQINTLVDEIYAVYCPQTNSIPKLLSDAYLCMGNHRCRSCFSSIIYIFFIGCIFTSL